MINQYPKKYETSWKLRDGRTVMPRQIKPEDAPCGWKCFGNFQKNPNAIGSSKSSRYAKRSCSSMLYDYDKAMAIVGEMMEGGRRKILGVVRLVVEPDENTGEIAFIIADPLQGMGLGGKWWIICLRFVETKDSKPFTR